MRAPLLALPLILSATLAATLAACAAAPRFEAPRQEIPQARFEPALTTLGGDSAALRRTNEERLAAARARFRDLDPKNWQGSGPWWLRYRSQLVTHVDGQTALVAVGEADGPAEPVARKAAAEALGRAEAERAFRSVLAKVSQGKSGRPPTSEARLRRAAVDAVYEWNGRTWVLLVCDNDCLEASGRAARVSLSGVALQPGEP
jgi:hypothetical protein